MFPTSLARYGSVLVGVGCIHGYPGGKGGTTYRREGPPYIQEGRTTFTVKVVYFPTF